MISWSEALEYYFLGWSGFDNVPNDVSNVLSEMIGHGAELDFS
jgi:hypothetical protein